ncbi:hypothetical protein ATCC90586_000123 [Pythium insidiosum]|nr:hypothetical protein ATCC90586_000123 [Pythium insidiosum]
MAAVSAPSASAAAWRTALDRCASGRSFGLLDDGTLLLWVDAALAFHPVHALLSDAPRDEPFVLVARLHPRVAALAKALRSVGGGDEVEAIVSQIVTSLTSSRQPTTTQEPSDDAIISFLHANAVDLVGGALRCFADCEASAREALTAIAMELETLSRQRAAKVDGDALMRDIDGVDWLETDLTVVVEHRGGYLARRFEDIVHRGAAAGRIVRIVRRDWSSDGVAQLTLDDALEAFDAELQEEMEITGGSSADMASNSLSIDVKAAFRVREDASRSVLDSSFLMSAAHDHDDDDQDDEHAQQLAQEFALFLSTARIFPGVHPENDTPLAKVVTIRHQEIQGSSNSDSQSFATIAQDLVSDPLAVVTAVIQAGEWKLKRDVSFWLGQVGFSSQECDEFVRAMPAYKQQLNAQRQHHWRAMDHVLQLCRLSRALQLPIAFVRPLVHDCAAWYASYSTTPNRSDYSLPSLFTELNAFIPEKMRAHLAEPLVWDIRMAFTDDFVHRVRVCQDMFLPCLLAPQDQSLVVDGATLQRLLRDLPESALSRPEIVAFVNDMEAAQRQQNELKTQQLSLPMGLTRFDCMSRILT